MMKKMFLMGVLMSFASSTKAADFSYMVFTLNDGSTQSIGALGLSLSFSDGRLTAINGADTLVIPLENLKKMEFSNDGTAGIGTIDSARLTIGDDALIYDLQGRQVTKEQMRKGVYIVKTKDKTWKVSFK